MPLLALELAAQGIEVPAILIKGALFTKGIINAYIIVILKLWQV
jgi:hypothetical protein